MRPADPPSPILMRSEHLPQMGFYQYLGDMADPTQVRVERKAS